MHSADSRLELLHRLSILILVSSGLHLVSMPVHARLCGGGAENSDRDDTQDFGLEFLKCLMIIEILAVVLSRSLFIF